MRSYVLPDPLVAVHLDLANKRIHSRHCAGMLVVWLFFCLAIPSHGLETRKMRGPKDGLVKTGVAADLDVNSSPLKGVLLGAVRFFQEWISPIDGSRCNFSPTCSHYGYQAVQDHPPLFGVVLTADRLMRCTYWTVAGKDYKRLPNGKLYDPVADNLLTHP